MKKALTILSAAVLLGGIFLTTGCNKTPFSRKGELITFGTVSGGAMTRAQYGDDFTKDSKTYQAIDWNVGDLIRVISAEAAVTNDGSDLHFADYKISSITSNNGASEGRVENANANGLTWTGASSYTFYAVYPSTTSISLDEATYGQVTASFITEAQSLPTGDPTSKTVGEGEDAITYSVYTPALTNAVLTAVATDVKENDEKPQVQLHFKPAWTAIEFNLSSLDDAIAITQIQLVADAESDDYLTGSFKMTAGDLSTVSVVTDDASKTATLSTGDGLNVTKTQGASLTMFILPVNNESVLKLRLTSKEDDGTKTSVVRLTKTVDGVKTPFVFEAGKKYRINGFKAPGSSWKIFIATDLVNVDEWGDPVDTTLIVE